MCLAFQTCKMGLITIKWEEVGQRAESFGYGRWISSGDTVQTLVTIVNTGLDSWNFLR